jgi:hypothetical protein
MAKRLADSQGLGSVVLGLIPTKWTAGPLYSYYGTCSRARRRQRRGGHISRLRGQLLCALRSSMTPKHPSCSTRQQVPLGHVDDRNLKYSYNEFNYLLEISCTHVCVYEGCHLPGFAAVNRKSYTVMNF